MPVVTDYTAILTNWSWNGQNVVDRPVILTYSFNTAPADYLYTSYSDAFLDSFEPLSPGEEAIARQALADWADASGIIFLEVPSGLGDIQFGVYNFQLLPGHEGSAGFAYYPSTGITEDFAYDPELGGDVFLYTGFLDYRVIAHEIGHALGFKHPFDGETTLDPSLDDVEHTVMSYTISATVSALGPFDLEAVAHVYGTDDEDGTHVASWSWNEAALTLTQTGTAGADTIRGVFVSDVMLGLEGDDILFGSFGDDSIEGGAGEDSLLGGGGADSLLGGADNDYARGDNGDDVIDGGDGNDYLSADNGNDAADGGGGADTVYGWDGADALAGGAGADYLGGGAGDDIISGGADGDSLDGGDGFDIASYADAAAGVVVDLSLWGFYQDTLGAGTDVLWNVEGLLGSAFGDTLLGDGAANWFASGAGADDLIGRGGDDVFVLGIDGGLDEIFGGDDSADSGFDTVDYSAAAAGIIVQLGAGYVVSGASQTLALISGIEAAIGSAFTDTLIGTAAGNRITGGAGADWLVGLGGDDTFVQIVDTTGIDRLFGDAGTDTIDYSAAGAGVTVQLSGYATGAGATLATFTGIENAVGASFNDVLVGNASNNRLTGGDGADWLVGQGGDDWFVQAIDTGGVDRLFGDAGIDTLDYSSASAGVTVQLSGYSTSGGVTLATFTGIENTIGTEFTDALIGNAADNRITGGAGADWLVGGAGNDVFVQSNDTASVDRLFGDAGVDTIDYSSASAAVTVQLSGYSVSGGATLATFTGIENAIGTNFNDALIGNASDNSLTGGAGADWLVGQGGADAFVYQSFAAGTDTIADFSRTQLDRIDLSAIDPGAAAGDQQFILSTVRTAGQTGEIVATPASATVTTLSLYLDADNVADQVINVIHESGLVMNAGDFVV